MPTPRKGRPPKIDPDLVNRLVTNLRLGAYMDAAAKYVGIGESTLYRWLDRGRAEAARVEDGEPPNPEETTYKELWEAIEKARAEAEIRHTGNITTAANNGTWQASAWWLERTRPNKFGRRLATEVTGPNGGPVEIDVQVTPEALSARIAALLGEDEGST